MEHDVETFKYRKLSPEAIEFLRNNAVKLDDDYQKATIGDCGSEICSYPLYGYTLADGDVAEEYVQHVIPGSGSVTFWGLKLRHGTQEIEWPLPDGYRRCIDLTDH